MTASLRNTFTAVTKSAHRKPPRPISIRITHEERAQLEREAGERTLSAYARSRLFGSEARRRGPNRRPAADSVALARILAKLGQSEIATNLALIAGSVRTGTVETGPALLAMLEQACADIDFIRRELIRALGIKAE